MEGAVTYATPPAGSNKHEYLLAFSCKGRWFCPSCHQKKVQLFGALLTETILFPVPHRHFTFGMPKMLRPYFRFDRNLLKDLCRIAHECLIEYLRTTLGLTEVLPGIVMAIHTFGEYLDFHPHLHALVADGLFVRSGLFYVMPDASLKPLEEMFRARVITFLVDKGLLPPARADMLRGWVRIPASRRSASGGNVHRSRRVLPDEREVIEKILRHLGLWEEGVRVHTGTDPPSETTVEPWLHDPFPDYDTEPGMMYANG